MISAFFKKNKIEIIIFLTVFFTYGVFTFWEASHLPFKSVISAASTDHYLEIANNLANRYSFALDDLRPTALRMPGYPFFLAIAFKILRDWWAVLFLQNAIAGLSAILLYSISKKWLPQIWAIITTLLWTFEPYSIDIPSHFLTETLYTFFLLLTVFLFIRYKDIIGQKKFILIIAVMLAILIYIRPTSILLPIIFAIAINYPFKNIKIYQTLALFAIIFLLLSPWLLRNYLVFEKWLLSSDNTSSFYIAILYFQTNKDGLKDLRFDEHPEKSEFPGFNNSGNLANTAPQFKTAVKVILSDPLSFIKFYFKKLAMDMVSSSWWGSIRNLIKGVNGEVNSHEEVMRAVLKFDTNKISHFSAKEVGALIVMASGIIFWFIMLIFSIIGSVVLFKNNNSATHSFLILFIGIILYLALIGNLAMCDFIRYRFPASPFIIMFAVCGFLFLIKKFQKTADVQ